MRTATTSALSPNPLRHNQRRPPFRWPRRPPSRQQSLDRCLLIAVVLHVHKWRLDYHWLERRSTWMDRKRLVLRRLHASKQHGGRPFWKSVTQRGIFVTMLSQSGAIEEQRGDRLRGASGKMPKIGREHPRPANKISRTNRFYAKSAACF